MFTYQDFVEESKSGIANAVCAAIRMHRTSSIYKTAMLADTYDRQQNDTITHFVKWLYTDTGRRVPDPFSSNNKLCSNLFNRLNTQRMTYSLGNGVSFPDKPETKDALGIDFDTQLHTAGYFALIHGVSFMFKNLNHVHVFKVTEFAPLYDEESGEMRGGVRFWQIDAQKPAVAILYEEDGYTKFRGDGGFDEMRIIEEKRAYRYTVKKAPADMEPEVVEADNYNGVLPIVPVYGSRLHQSTLIGMQSKIDAYDLVLSGFANDLNDCSEIYWLVSGAGGATDKDLARFRDKLKLNHIGMVPNGDEVQITPYTQEIPFAARKELLESLKASIYEDFGALDVHTISAGSTNDHIDAAYQPMDENADDFEYQIIVAVQALLALDGVDGQTPSFKRNRISNIKETTEVVLMCAPFMSDDMVRAHLPILTSDEVEAANEQAAADETERITVDDEQDDI